MKKQYKSPKIKSFVVEMESPIAGSPWLPVDESGDTIDQGAVEAKRHYRLIIDDDDEEEEW